MKRRPLLPGLARRHPRCPLWLNARGLICIPSGEHVRLRRTPRHYGIANLFPGGLSEQRMGRRGGNKPSLRSTVIKRNRGPGHFFDSGERVRETELVASQALPLDGSPVIAFI
ncbi:hypothetical protein DPEC_G00148550 [Dallia pectoralis]|uniref:Uncharacterized protein n=1 Tax=Dallia pectoralis TaxID=75939 RepID=A0ACC2GJ26_DALPE|nr:hypothetical protein DPEC_G00148550 [Dallia pectoralis]